MKAYKNLNEDSGVTHIKIGKDYIDVKFKDKPTIYNYSYSKTGKIHVERMKILARNGRGLSTYIAQHPEVKNNYNER